ncbi:MAG: DUF3043 domain-containing protein, partial [Solirubrobacterales bacterium]|nr:DUF3043 domain-containing protein [Solirubrobacterales bacterium]
MGATGQLVAVGRERRRVGYERQQAASLYGEGPPQLPTDGLRSVFGRRTSITADSSAESAPHGATAQPVGKGRPTPTRSEAEAARKKRATPPRNRKEAAARQKAAVRSSRTKMREAMATGDDRYLPARDQGPVRRYVRDYVDTHRSIGEFLLPIFFVIFLLVYVNTTWAATVSSAAWIVVIAALARDSVRT